MADEHLAASSSGREVSGEGPMISRPENEEARNIGRAGSGRALITPSDSAAATTSANPCALLASAAWAADARERQALEREDFAASREWRAVAAEVRRVWDLALEAARPRSSRV